MIKGFGLALAFSCLTVPAIAMDAKGKFLSRGVGTDSCGRWTELHNEKTYLTGEQNEWLMGYLTAYNFWSLRGRSDAADKLDGDGLIAAVTHYCAAHPLDTVANASADLVRQLETRKKAGK